jgi:hypothetical protein
MTETTADIQSASERQGRRDLSNILMNLIIALLAPMFLGVTAGDIRYARMAAIETVNAYRARNHADLIAVAQIVAFGLAALGSLSLSFADDLSLSMTLRLRGNANALNRSAEQNRRVLRQSRDDDPMQHLAPIMSEPETPIAFSPGAFPEDDVVSEPGTLLSLAAEQELVAEAQARLQSPAQNAEQDPVSPPAPALSTAPAPSEKRDREMWAIAMVQEAAEINAGIPNLPPAERKAATIQAAALSSAAHDLMYGAPLQPLRPAAPASPNAIPS